MKTWKKWGIGCGALAVVAAAWVYLLVFHYFQYVPLFDDGPFSGVVRNDLPGGQPEQVLPIFEGLRLEVYARTESDPAPSVLLRAKDGAVRWCVYATGPEKTQVGSIEFLSYHSGWLTEPAVVGVVDWTFGRERTVWLIDRNGELKEYWYSW